MQDLFSRFTARDPLLLAALYSGDAATSDAVARMLRLTPLTTLTRHTAALVDVLDALPEVHDRLRATWGRADPRLTAQLFSWVEQTRLRVARTDHEAPLPTRAERAAAFMRAEETVLV